MGGIHDWPNHALDVKRIAKMINMPSQNDGMAMPAIEKARTQLQNFGAATNPVARSHGGLIRYLAAGGFAGRGIDRIPAMLSRGEFVVNARSTKRFYSQLQAINSGQAPTFRSQGGAVTNVTIGDINVQGGSTPTKTGRAIAFELRREMRRGSIRQGLS